MRWNAKDYSQWHSYYAWRPTKVQGEWVWFERIMRQGRYRIGSSQSGKSTRSQWDWVYVNSEFDLIKQQEMKNASGPDSAMSAGQAMSGQVSGPHVSKITTKAIK